MKMSDIFNPLIIVERMPYFVLTNFHSREKGGQMYIWFVGLGCIFPIFEEPEEYL